MEYAEAVDWLFSQLPNYQKQGSSAYKPGLETITELLERIGNPHKKLKTIHVAGTNGKGSVCHILSAVLQTADKKVGLFTSPHITDFRERIKINGEMVDQDFVVDFVGQCQKEFTDLEPSFFEITTAMAFRYFAEQNCDISIIETGLGGRLDSTNVLNPLVSVITNIGMEHTEYLGDTIEDIATEKGGIIKENTPLVIGSQSPKSRAVLEKIAESRNAPCSQAAELEIETDLLGSFQKQNLNTAYAVVNNLNELGWTISNETFHTAVKNVSELSSIKARMQVVSTSPLIILDAAHNTAAVKILMGELDSLEFEELFVIFGASADKDISAILKLIPTSAHLYLTEFNSSRSAKKDFLSQTASEIQLEAEVFTIAKEAFAAAQKRASADDLILVFGSFYLLEDLD